MICESDAHDTGRCDRNQLDGIGACHCWCRLDDNEPEGQP